MQPFGKQEEVKFLGGGMKPVLVMKLNVTYHGRSEVLLLLPCHGGVSDLFGVDKWQWRGHLCFILESIHGIARAKLLCSSAHGGGSSGVDRWEGTRK
jgi:hypothetical protein